MSVRPAQFRTVSRPRHQHARLRQDPDPVFVDRTGRRRRVAAIAASVAGIVLVLVALVIFVGFTGVAGGHLPGLPGAVDPAATKLAPVPERSASPPEHPTRPSVAGDPAAPTSNAPTSGAPSHTSNGHKPSQTPSHPGKK